MIYTCYWESMREPISRNKDTIGYSYEAAMKYSILSVKGYEPGFVLGTIPEYTTIHRADLMRPLLDSNKDSFLFIVTNLQLQSWKYWVRKHKMEKYIAKTIGPLVNENYPGSEPRLNIFVLAGLEHIIRKEENAKT